MKAQLIKSPAMKSLCLSSPLEIGVAVRGAPGPHPSGSPGAQVLGVGSQEEDHVCPVSHATPRAAAAPASAVLDSLCLSPYLTYQTDWANHRSYLVEMPF